jgi:uncharacterized membrane protein YfcA
LTLTLSDVVLVAAAGVLAGAVNTAAGGGTLISFPALLAAGLPPISANITSAIGLVPGYAGGAYAYRRELQGQRHRFLVLLAGCALGGICGAFLLLNTPVAAFKVVVPYLVIVSCLLLLVQPRLAAWISTRREDNGTDDTHVGFGAQTSLFLSAVYGSYFGAGLGVLMLAVMGIFIPDNLQRLNGLKGLLSLVVVTGGVTVYLLSGQASLPHVAVLVVTSLIGGILGGSLARRLSPTLLRRAVCVLGFGVAAVLLLRG